MKIPLNHVSVDCTLATFIHIRSSDLSPRW
jgi:hypothetical protein